MEPPNIVTHYTRRPVVLDTSGVGDFGALVPLLLENRVHVRISLDALSGVNDQVRPTNRLYVRDGVSSEYAKKAILMCVKSAIPVTVQTVVSTRLAFCTFRSSLSPILQRVGGFFECVHPERGR